MHGCKRTLSAVLRRLEEEANGSFSAEATWAGLGALARETVDAISEQIDLSTAQRCFHILGLDVLLDATGRPWLLEANHRPSLLVDEVHPLAGAAGLSRAEVNKVMAASKSKGGDKWGKPCRCSLHPALHEHQVSTVDVAAKCPAVEGALVIARRTTSGGDAAAWAEGTIYQLV